MTNPSIAALDQAIAELEATISHLPARPGSVRASSQYATITLDADGLLIDVDFVAERLPGLTALADDLLGLQDKAIAALTGGQPDEGVELGDPAPAGRSWSIGRNAPQLPEMPTRADLDRVAAELEAHFVTAAAESRAPRAGRAESALVSVEVDSRGLLHTLTFRDQARKAAPEVLAADLLEVTTEARAAIA